MDEIIEILAEQAHKSWSGWAAWMFSRWDYTHPEDSSFQNRWKRQIDIPYSELSEEEKESDRQEARDIIEALSDNGYVILHTGSSSNNFWGVKVDLPSHLCANGNKMRPYPRILCSMCKPSDYPEGEDGYIK